jgi:ATP-dependent Clp protease ATP-binding subunit ClpA
VNEVIRTPHDACDNCGAEYDFHPDRDFLVVYLGNPECNMLVAQCPECEAYSQVFCDPPTLVLLQDRLDLAVDTRLHAPEEVQAAWRQMMGLPESGVTAPSATEKVNAMLSKSYREIVAHLRSKLVGQPRAIAQLERALKIAEAGLRDIDKPLGIFVFAGPTGTGKSEAVRALAEAIHGDPDELCRVDCNLLTESHTVASLTGSPPGYVGSDTGNTLLNKKTIEGKSGRPGLLVLEEIEKAHPAIFDTLLGIFDKALLNLTNARGKISFANTFIIMTTNLGARELARSAQGALLGFALHSATQKNLNLSGEARRNIVEREMERTFKPEFRNRLDDTVVFRWLDQPELMIIVGKFISELNEKLIARHPHYLKVEESALAFLVSEGRDVANGARPLKRAIRKYVEDPLAEALIDGLPHSSCLIYVQHHEGDKQLTFSYEALPVLVPVVAPPVPEVEPAEGGGPEATAEAHAVGEDGAAGDEVNEQDLVDEPVIPDLDELSEPEDNLQDPPAGEFHD